MSAAARAAWRGWEDWREVETGGGKVSFAKEEGGKKRKGKERKNALWEKKKSPRARPLVNDLRVKPTAAAAQAAAASAPREDARVDVDVGGRGAPPGRVARGAGLAGGASAGVSSGQSRGRRRRRCCLRGPGHLGCFFFPPPLPPPMQFTWEGVVIGVTSQGEACCLLTDRFFFPFSFL